MYFALDFDFFQYMYNKLLKIPEGQLNLDKITLEHNLSYLYTKIIYILMQFNYNVKCQNIFDIFGAACHI